MQKLATTAALISVVLIAGCATSTEEIVKIGPDTYRVAALGRFADYSSSALRARLYQDAYRHCAAQNKIMVPATNGSHNSGSASNELSEVQFRCLARNEARLPSTPAPTL